MNKTNINIPCDTCDSTTQSTCDRCKGSGSIPLESTFKTVCIVCNKELKISDGFVLDGSSLDIITGYGSEHDGDTYSGYICDQCITTKDKVEAIRYVRNYMFPDFTKEVHRKLLFNSKPFPQGN